MAWFGRRQVTPPPLSEERLAALERDVAEMARSIRGLETEQINLHDQVRRWMRRAVAAEARAASAGDSRSPAQSPPPARLTMWGARARIAARRAQEAAEHLTPAEPEEVQSNGVHP